MKLKKLDFTKHPIASQIRQVSLTDYVATDSTPVTPKHVPPEQEKSPKQKTTQRRSLYSSAKPPSEF